MSKDTTHTTAKPIIALDADGVLLDYHAAYRNVWGRVFGELPELRDPLAYWPMDRWAVRRLESGERVKFRAYFDEDFWSTIPPVAGAVEACLALSAAGFELVCVSAVKPQYQSARLNNLRGHGYPVERVIATANTATDVSPKAAALHALRPVAFVDDYVP